MASHTFVRNSVPALLVVLFLFPLVAVAQESPDTSESRTLEIFQQNMIHFNPDSAGKFETAMVNSADNGRVIYSDIELPDYPSPVKITAYAAIHPIPQDVRSVYDRWDRAGNVRLSRGGMADVEIIKFITSYGGFTEYTVDVSHLAPLLRGPCTIKGFIDTWVSPAWKMDFKLTFEPTEEETNPRWAHGLAFIESFNDKDMGKDGITTEVEIPNGLERVIMKYYVSGHCTDGRDADEFVTKDNVIYVDGQVVYRFRPWRDDCRQFREINPYCTRWSEGYWSSDFSRSGWCPGDQVNPVDIDLSDHLTSGKHTVRFMVENVRPEDEDGHFGYWRVSSQLVGWDKK